MSDNASLESLRQEVRALREQETLFRQFLDNSPTAAFLKDAQGRYVYANRPALRLLHKSAEEVLGKTDFDLLPADLARQMRDRDREVLASDRTLHLAEAVPAANGTLRHWLVLKFPFRGENEQTLVGGVALDVTDQQRAEDQLRQAVGLLRAVTEALPDAVYVKDRSGRYLLINSPGARLIGKTIAEVVGQDDVALFDPEAARFIQDVDRQVLESGEARTYEQVATAGGVTRSWQTLKVPLRDREGKVIGLIGISRDASGQRRVEEELRASETRFRALIEKSYDGIALLAPDRRILYVSPAIVRMLGYLPEELMGQDAYSILHPDDLAGSRDVFTRLLDRPGAVSSEQVRFRHKGGSWRWLECVKTNLLTDPAIRAVVVNFRDVTDRKAAEDALRGSEARLRLLVEQMPAIVWTTDRDLRITSSEGTALAALGLKPGEVAGRLLTEYLGTDDPNDPILATHRQVLAGEAYTFETEWQGRVYESHLEPLRNHGPEVTGVIGVALDVTPRKRAEEALHKAEEQLRQAQKMEAVGRLAAGVAHDFNNLLTVINGYSEVLLQHLSASETDREMLEEIRRAGERASALTGQLLAFSRKQAQRLEVLDLNVLLADLERLLSRLIGEDVELVTSLESTAALVRADRGQLTQVVMNLVANARDAMPGGGTLLARVRNVELDEAFARDHPDVRPGPYAELTVCDTGVGMDEATLAHAYEPFFTTKPAGQGTGLGLALVYGIVKQLSGHVEIASRLGQGTSCAVYLPRVEELPRSVAEPGPEPRGRETILLAEDEEGVRELARLVLRSIGYAVLEAADGPAALALAERHPGPIHLLLTDVVMPLMSGPQLAERLRSARPDLKVLYLSGYPDEALSRHGLRSGEGFLRKPFTPSMLASRIREALDAGAPKE